MGLVLHFAPSNIMIVGVQTPLSLFFNQDDLPKMQNGGAQGDIFNELGSPDEQNASNP